MKNNQKVSAAMMKMPQLLAAILLAGALAAQAQTNTATASTNQIKSGVAQVQPKATAPTNGWKSSVSFGVTLSRGNTDTTMASATAATEKKWLQNDLMFGGDALYGETKIPGQATTQETAETLHGYTQYNRNFWGTYWNGFYGYFRADAFHDGVADIKYRVVLAPGVGCYFITNKTEDLVAEIGPGYVKEQLGEDTESYATMRLVEMFHYNISPHAKAWETLKFLPQVDRFDNYLVIGEAGIEAGLTKNNKLSLRLVLQDNYNSIPAVGKLKNDLKVIGSLAYKF